MATSGSSDFNQTRDEIITRALRICGAVGQGETPSATAITEASTAFNAIIKEKQADGMPLWAILEYTLTPVSGTASYTIAAPAPLKVLSAWYRNTSTGFDTPLLMITKDQYYAYTNKSTTGTPNQFFYQTPGYDGSGTVILYNVPNSTFASANTIRFYGQRPFEDMDSSANNLDFPTYWINALTWALASELSFEYGVGLSERGMIGNKAREAHQMALSFSTEEGSLMLQPMPNWEQ